MKILGNETLLKWFPEKSNDEVINVYLLYYRIPSEDGYFYIERSKGSEIKERYLIVPRKIRNKVKALRFEFYEIMKKHGVVKTSIGYLVPEENVEELRLALRKWIMKWKETQKDLDTFLKDPQSFKDWPFIMKVIKEFNLTWPPKNLDLAKRVRIEFLGPLKLPKTLYNELLEKAT